MRRIGCAVAETESSGAVRSPFPPRGKLRGHRCPDKREQQQAQNKKAGGGGLPRTSGDVFTPSVFTETNSRISTYALRYSLSSFPGAEEGKALRFHGNLFTGARIAASITAVFLHLKTAEPADLHTAAFKGESFMLSTNVLTTRVASSREMLA